MKAQHLRVDRISSLPSSIIEKILCLVPIQEAARTSILAKNWRYNWLTIPKLEFIVYDFKVTTDENQLSVLEQTFELPSDRKKMSKRCKFFYAIFQILLVHRGPIHEFKLSMEADDSCVEIDHIILHLSRNHTLKKINLQLSFWYVVPSCIFLLHQLTHLYLYTCDFDYHPKTSNGFGNLTTLSLHNVVITPETLHHLISNCPLLKNVTVILSYDNIGVGDPTICDLFECLQGIEHLTIRNWVIQCFAGDGIPRELPISLLHLKYSCVKDMCLRNDYGLPFLLLLLRCSPNLEKIKLKIHQYEDDDVIETDSVDYSDIWLDHLKEFEIIGFANLKIEMELVKVILAKSPVLKKVSIYHTVAMKEEVRMLKRLLRSPRASPVVDIIVERSCL